MYKKLIIGLCALMIAVLMFGCNNNADSGNPTETTLPVTEMPISINDKLIENGSKAIASAEGVVLPVISCFESFGASIEWNSDAEANLIYNNENYILNTDEMTLSKSDVPNSNYLYGIYGGNYLLYEQNKEIFLDVNAFVDFFERFGISVDVNVDMGRCVVYINDR